MADKRLIILLPGNQLFGQEQALIGIAKILRTYGYSPHFLLHSKWGHAIANHLEGLGFKVSMLPMGTLWSVSLAIHEPKILLSNIWAVIATSFIFFKLNKREQYPYIILGNSTFSLYLLPVLFLTRITVIYRHGDDAPNHSLFHRIMMKILFKRVDRHTANCNYLKNQLTTRFPKINPRIIYNTPWRDAPCKYINNPLVHLKPTNPKRILYVGQLSEHKGILLLLEAFRILAPDHPDFVIDLVGEIPGVGKCKNDEISYILKQTMIDFPDRILQYGFQNDVSKFYQNASIHVCPSVWQDPSPNVVLEAKQYAVPSIAFNVGGLSELITHKVNGFICSHISSNALADGIRYFIENDIACEIAGKAAKDSINEKFSKRLLGEQWIKLLLNTDMKSSTD